MIIPLLLGIVGIITLPIVVQFIAPLANRFFCTNCGMLSYVLIGGGVTVVVQILIFSLFSFILSKNKFHALLTPITMILICVAYTILNAVTERRSL